MTSLTGQGRVIAGRYRVLRPVGSGAHGVVDLAEDVLNGGRRVAVKRLEGIVGAGDPEPAADILRWFLHPRWAEILDEGRLDDHGRFQVTRYVPGQSLDGLPCPLPPREVARFLEDGARVLGALHGLGLIHYDVTPGNWIREEAADGPHFTLTDGGLANVGPVRGIARGTPLFMAPEVVEGANHDHRADLYGLGLVAFRLATGVDPFQGGAGEVLGKRRRLPAPLARTVRPDVPAALERIIAGLLQREPDRRVADAAALLGLLAAEGWTATEAVLPEEAVALASGGRIVGRADVLARFRAACRGLTGSTPPPPAPGVEASLTDEGGSAPDLVLLLHGAPGVGATRVVREFAAIARAEGVPVLVLSGRQGAADRRSPLRRLSDALHYVGVEGEGEGSAPAVDARSSRGEADGRGAETAEARTIERFVELCERVSARTPVALLVEDFAELPPSAQEGLRVLGRHLLTRAEHPEGRRAPRILLAVDHGPEDPAAFLIPDAAHPRRPCHALSPLDDAELSSLLAGRFPGLEPPPQDFATIRRVSEGLPRLVVSLLAEGLRRHDLRRETGRWIWDTDALAEYRVPRLLPPATVRALESASPDVRDAATRLALLDAPAPETFLVALAGRETTAALAESALVAVSHEGEQTRIAVASRGLSRALRACSPVELAGHRRAVLEALAAHPCPDLVPDGARLLWESGDAPAAFRALTSTTSSLPPSLRARVSGVLAQVVQADPSVLADAAARLRAVDLLSAAAETAPLAQAILAALPARLDRDDLETVSRLACHAYETRQYARAIALGEAASRLEPDDAAARRALASLRITHARAHLASKSLAGARDLLAASLRAVRRLGPAGRAGAPGVTTAMALTSARFRIAAREFERAEGLNRRALRRARRAHLLFPAAHAYNNLAVCLQHLGRPTEAEFATSRAIRIRMALGDLQGAVGNLHNLARLKQLRGAVLEAAALHARAVALGSRFAHYEGTALALLSLSSIYDSQSNPRLAVTALLRARDISRAHGNVLQAATAARSASILLALTGNYARARALLLESARHARTAGRGLARHSHFQASATLAFLLGDYARANSQLLHSSASRMTDAHARLATVLRACARLGLLHAHVPLPSSVRVSTVSSAYRRAIAHLLRFSRREDADTATRAIRTLEDMQTQDGAAPSPAEFRMLLEFALAVSGRTTASITVANGILGLIARVASHQGVSLVRARVSALRAQDALARSQYAQASQELTAALAELTKPSSLPVSAERPQAPRAIPREFRLVSEAWSARPGTPTRMPRRVEDFWTQLHATAHLLLLESGATALPDTRLQAALRTILSVSTRLKTGAGLEALLESLNTYAREITRAEHTCVVLLDPSGAREVRIASSSSSPRSQRPIPRISHTVIQRVMSSRKPLLLHDVFGDSELMERPSIVSLSLRSVVCVPMVRGGQLYGAMYADSTAGAGSFDKVDLEILSLFAEQAAAAIETSRLLVDIQRSYSELKATQERLIRGERLRVMGEMTSGVAHEFNNLLTAILARIQLLSLDYLSPAVRENLKLIEKAALDAAGVVRRLQGLARSQRQADYQQTDLAEVCADVVELLRPLWATRRHAARPPITVRLRVARGLLVYGDPTELREVLTNLLKNSLDALERGGSVLVSGESREGRVRIEIADDGPGIPKALQSKIFTPFFTTKGERGTGLGLCLSQQIIERHGGELTISSVEGVGTTAAFELPVVVPPQRAEQDPGQGVSPADRSISVVVVDDDPDVLTPLCGYLQRSGFRVKGSASAADALAQIASSPPDVVISDIAMPGIDGLELCQRLRQQHPLLPIVLMTGRASEVDPAQAAQTGASALLPKPFTMRQVTDLLTRVARATSHGT